MIYIEKGVIGYDSIKNNIFNDRKTCLDTLIYHIQNHGYMVCFPKNGTNGHKKIYIYTDSDFLDLNKNHRPSLSKYVGSYQYMYARNLINENTLIRNKIEVLKKAIVHLGLNLFPIQVFEV